jgi:hypothetical protein
VEKVEQLRNMGACQKGGEKRHPIFPTCSTARQMVRSEISMITRFAAHHFQKPCCGRRRPSVFHLWHALQETLMPSHTCRVGILLLQCHPSPHTVLMHPRHSFPLRRSFCCVTIASSTHVSMFPQRGRRTGAGAAFQPLAISPY